MAEEDDSSSVESTAAAGTRGADQVPLTEAPEETLVTETEAGTGTEIKMPHVDDTLRGDMTETSHQPPQAQQQRNSSSEAFEQISLLATSTEQVEGRVGVNGNENQATTSQENASAAALSDSHGGVAVGIQAAAAVSSPETISPSAETAPSPSAENEAHDCARADGTVGSSGPAHIADSGESGSVRSSSVQPPLLESVDGDCDTRLPATEVKEGDSSEGGSPGRRRSDVIDSTIPKVEGSELGEDGSNEFAALHDEDRTTLSGSAIELNDLKQPAGNDLPQHVPSYEGSGVNTMAEEFRARFSGNEGLGRVVRVSFDARKLADEIISSSLVTVAAAARTRMTAADKNCPSDQVAGMDEVPIQGFSQGTPSAEQIDLRKEGIPLPESTEGFPDILSAPIRAAVVNSFLDGVYEIASALGAAAAARVPPPAVGEMPKEAVDSTTAVAQQQPVPMEPKGSDQFDEPGKTGDHALSESNASAPASEPLVKPATVVVDDEMKDGGKEGEKQQSTGTVHTDDKPSPPSSASLRAAVVKRFTSETRDTIASEVATKAVEPPSDKTSAAKTSPDEPRPTRDKPIDGIIQPAPVSNVPPSECEPLVDIATSEIGDEHPPSGDDEMEGGGEEGEKQPTGTVSVDDQPNLPSSASLRTAVVQDFMSETSEAIASEAVATAVETPPPDTPPGTEMSSVEPATTRDEYADGVIQLEKTAKEIEEPATEGVGDERTTGSDGVVVDDKVEDEQRSELGPTDDEASPPSSASLRAAVVQDFMSETSEAIASEAVATAVETPPPDTAVGTKLSSEHADGVIQLEKTAKETEEPATEGVGDERTTGGDGVVVDDEVEDEQRSELGPTDDEASLPSSASLRAAVVQDFMSETSETIASEAVATAVETPPPDTAVGTKLSSEHADGVIQLEKTAKETEEPATEGVGDERTTGSGGVVVDDEVGDKQRSELGPKGDGASPPSASLRAAVVQDFMSETSEAIASEAVATAVETPPPDTAPGTKSSFDELQPTRDELADDNINPTGDHVPPAPGTSASRSEPLVEPATKVAGDDEQPPTGGNDEMAGGETRAPALPSSPSPPWSASFRGAVVADFLSGVYDAVATTEARAIVAAPSVPTENADSVPAPTEDDQATSGVVELDTSRECIETPLAALDTYQSGGQAQRQEEKHSTATTQQLEQEAAKQEEEVQQAASVLARPSGASLQQSLLLSDESLHILVVEDYLSDTLPGLLSAEAESEEAATVATKRDQVYSSHEPGAAAAAAAPAGASRTANARDVQDGSNSGGEESREEIAAVQAVRNSIVEAMAATEQRSTSPGGSCGAFTRGGKGPGVAEAPDGLCSPTPPGTPEEERNGSTNPGLGSGVLTEELSLDYASHPPNPRSAEALAYLVEAGDRAKSRWEAPEEAPEEAAVWLSHSGVAARTSEDHQHKARAEASSWLRDTGARALSSRGRGIRTSQEEAVEWLCLVGRTAKSAQDRTDKARADASSWLRERGGRALSLEGREQAGRLECAAWLRLCGGRAKSAQGRAERARSEAVSWLTGAGGRAVSQQERAAGARSNAANWLALRAASELDRTTTLAERSAGAPAPAATAKLDGSLSDARAGECGGLNVEDVGKTPTTGDVISQAEGATTQGHSQPGSTAVRGSPRADRPSDANITDDVRARETGEDTAQLSPRHDDGAREHLAGDKNIAATAAATLPSGDAGPLPSRQSTNPAGSETGAADAGAAATATATAPDEAAGEVDHRVGRSASTDRTAPAPWLEPATTPLARGGSFAPTAAGAEDFGRMLDVGETEWCRVSLSRTPPFDALNSPSLPLRYAPVRGRPRALPRSDSEERGIDDAGFPSAAVDGTGPGPGPVAATGTASHPPGGSEWMGFFAPPNQMAPKGDAYRGSDSFGSADASACTTVRADSTGSFIGGSGNNARDRRRCSGGGSAAAASEESWGASLSEAHSPVGEAQSRIMWRAAGGGRRGEDRWEETSEDFVSPSASRSLRAQGEGSSRKRWHKQAEQSRQYMQRWEKFLGRAHRHFDGEADVRKRMSVIRRAHPDVSNEVAFVALAQSRGRSSEAAAVLHLPRAKDEAALVAMMLDVAAFVALARETAERRRRSRQLEKHRRSKMAAAGAREPAPSFPSHRPKEELSRHPSEQEREHEQEQRWRYHGHAPAWREADDSSSQLEGGADTTGRRIVERDAGEGRYHDHHDHHHHQHHDQHHPQRFAESSGGGSRGELQSRRSGSAPSLLPPIEGRLIEGTPPSPASLRAVLSTSTSVAVEVPRGFGLVPEAARAPPQGDERFRPLDPKANRRELRAMIRARALMQRQRMAEMSVPGEQQKQQRGGAGLDALTERFFRETRALDRDSEHLDDRLRGRRLRKKKRRRRDRGWRDTGQDGGEAGGSTVACSSKYTTRNAGCGDSSGDGGGGRGGGRGGGKSMLFASLNGNTGAPPLLFGANDVGRAGISSRDSLSTAAAATAAESCADGAGGGGGSCRVQSYFAQALGDGRLCGSRS
eukprot:g9284.t1